MVTCYLGVGSNLGNRRHNIEEAVKRINRLKDTRVVKSSSLRQTEPCGGPAGQPKFLNAALKITTGLSPSILLKGLKSIERSLGRVNTARNGPRIIDLDILLYGERVIRSKDLSIPHPRMFERDFVIKPLREVL
ncbi:MAG: 2-amino-4-hydroxy-6-hydroxymethyldihydropteridine diphosphokinase [Candidatus Omnitrophota bacterium]